MRKLAALGNVVALERCVIKSSVRSLGTVSRPYETVFRLARHESKRELHFAPREHARIHVRYGG